MKKVLQRVMILLVLGTVMFLLQRNTNNHILPLQMVDHMMRDALYQVPKGTSPEIKIIGIDEEILNEYGVFQEWSREKIAELISLLTANPNYAPAVIGLDILFIGETEGDADIALANACEQAGNVVTAANIVYRTAIEKSTDGVMYYDVWNADMVEIPYSALNDATTHGFTNALQDNDGYTRQTQLFVKYEGKNLESFAYSIYRNFQEKLGREVVTPKTYSRNMMQFLFSGKIGGYEKVSMCDVLNGKVDIKAFQDCIVLIGCYAPGMLDAYNVAVERGSQMYGVEIHANIIQSLLEGKTAVPVNSKGAALVAAVVVMIYFAFAARNNHLLSTLLSGMALMIVWAIAGKLLVGKGFTLSLLYFEGVILFLMIYFIVNKYVLEKYRRRRVLLAFEKYVAPQVVKQLASQGEFEIKLGGEKREIAVLFVDIRGFTPMSEGLEPEQVVGILNEYLELTSRAIFQNQGTLDKFIGDATMAIFNAPFDSEDYIYRAICTARDIVEGTEALSKKLMERFGKTISFGIGINCGPAVVGNIGSERRMDYTAIGDTVNTAARLESVASRGQVLMSEAVYQAMKDRVEAEPVGELELKGKSQKVMTYSLNKVL